MIREWNIASYGDNSRLLCIKNTEQYYIHNSKTHANAGIYQHVYNNLNRL